MASTELSYNGITLQILTTNSIESTPTYDIGDQTVAYTKTVFDVKGIIAYNDDDNLQDLGTQANAYRTTLLVPRADFNFNIDGEDLFDISAPDALGGPKPRKCTITNIMNSRYAEVNFVIEINYPECPDDENGDPVDADIVTSYRYGITHQYSDNFACRRTITGAITVREDALEDNSVSTDSFRNVVVPGVPQWFRREAMNFNITPNGNTLDFEIIDQEVYLNAPSPASKATGQYAEIMNFTGTGKGEALSWSKIIDLEVEAPLDVDKLDLFSVAYALCLDKLGGISWQDPTQGIVRQINISEQLFENKIRIQIAKETYTAGQDIDNSTFLPTTTNLFQSLLNESDMDHGIYNSYGPYGSALIQAGLQLFQGHCTGTTPPLASDPDALTQTNDYTTISITTGDPGLSGPPQTGSTTNVNNIIQGTTPYLYYNHSITYGENNGVVLLPSSAPLIPATIYQMHNPYIVAYYNGSASRLNAFPHIPGAESLLSGIISKRSITNEEPKPSSTGTGLVYTTHWYYELLIPLTAANLGIQINNFVTILGNPGTQNPSWLPVPLPTNEMLLGFNGNNVLTNYYDNTPVSPYVNIFTGNSGTNDQPGDGGDGSGN